MQVLDAQQNLVGNLPDVLLRQILVLLFLGLDELLKVPSFRVLHHYVERFLLQKTGVELNYVRMPQLLKNLNLAHSIELMFLL